MEDNYGHMEIRLNELLKENGLSKNKLSHKAGVLLLMSGIAQLLRAEQVSAEQRQEYAKGIEDAAARLSSLISNILKLNRLEHQNITPEIEVYDVCRQLCESIFLFEDAVEEKN